MIGALPAIGLAYLLGALSPARWISRLSSGIDIRNHGSGNAGATNVLRVVGWRQAVAVLAFDVAKGAAAAWLPNLWIDSPPPGLSVACGAAAVAGHIWPLFHRFRGGRGVATATGALALTHPALLAAAVAVFVLTLALCRTVWPASVAAAIAVLPGFLALAAWNLVEGQAGPGRLESISVVGIAAAVVWAHRDRISSRLRR